MIEHIRPTTQIPAVQGQFGPRLATYTTQLPASAIETILGHDPRSKGSSPNSWRHLPHDIGNIYEHLQRATTKARLDAIMRYIRYRFIPNPIVVGAFPAISIAVQNGTTFEPIPGAMAGIGILHFDLSRRNLRVVVDGLGRASAALELVEMSESKEISKDAQSELKKLLTEFSLPTVFYMPAPEKAPLTLEEMQQLFHDFNFKLTAVPARLAIALDHSDLYIGLTNRIGNSPLIKRFGGMELKSASLGKKSTAIVVQQNLLKFIRGATEGEEGLEASANTEFTNSKLKEENLHDFEEKISEFLNSFVSSMGDEKFKDKESLHLSAPGWAALGALFNDLFVRLRVPNMSASAAALGRIQWQRDAEIWAEVMKTDMEGKVKITGAGGASTRRAMIRIIRSQLGIDKLLAEQGL